MEMNKKENIKVIFLSHPYADNPEENQLRIKYLVKKIREKFSDIIIISPLHMFSYFKEEVPEFREKFMGIFKTLIRYEADELWVSGVTEGCIDEVRFTLDIDKDIYVIEGELDIVSYGEHIIDKLKYIKGDYTYKLGI